MRTRLRSDSAPPPSEGKWGQAGTLVSAEHQNFCLIRWVLTRKLWTTSVGVFMCSLRRQISTSPARPLGSQRRRDERDIGWRPLAKQRHRVFAFSFFWPCLLEANKANGILTWEQGKSRESRYSYVLHGYQSSLKLSSRWEVYQKRLDCAKWKVPVLLTRLLCRRVSPI